MVVRCRTRSSRRLGTSNRREYLIADGQVVSEGRDDRGILEMAGAGYEEALAAIRATHGDHPVLLAGMVGSNRGWREAPYVDAPATPERVAASLLWVEPAAPRSCPASPGATRRRQRHARRGGAAARRGPRRG
jgi:2-dehydro-3-deoxygalactonokinase